MSDLVPKTDIISNIVLKGDLSGLSALQRMDYYNRMCQHVGIDPVTQPFSLLTLSGKMVLYCNKGGADQLRKLNGVSVTDLQTQRVDDIWIVIAKGVDKSGRTDAATGAVNIATLKSDALANAIMKAETKAKRRLTLSLCGLGMLDESEIETIPEAQTYDVGEPPQEDLNRGALLKRFTTIGDYLLDDEKAKIRAESVKLQGQALADYIKGWEDKVHKRAGAGVPDDKIPL
jgi:hypothetical protein